MTLTPRPHHTMSIGHRQCRQNRSFSYRHAVMLLLQELIWRLKKLMEIIFFFLPPKPQRVRFLKGRYICTKHINVCISKFVCLFNIYEHLLLNIYMLVIMHINQLKKVIGKFRFEYRYSRHATCATWIEMHTYAFLSV